METNNNNNGAGTMKNELLIAFERNGVKAEISAHIGNPSNSILKNINEFGLVIHLEKDGKRDGGRFMTLSAAQKLVRQIHGAADAKITDEAQPVIFIMPLDSEGMITGDLD